MNRPLHTRLMTRNSQEKHGMFFKCCRGSISIASQFGHGVGPDAVVANRATEVGQFKGEGSAYLLY